MHRLPYVSLGMALAGAIAASPANAAQMPEALKNAPGFEVAEGRVSRGGLAPIYNRVPAEAQPAWAAFARGAGGDWQAMWNPETGVPQRIFGSGISAPGAVESAASAEAHARRALRDHLELLAPGARLSDFELAVNHLDETGMRTVGFMQHHEGVRVLGGHVSFRFRNDRLFVIASQAFPDVRVSRAFASVSARAARERARGWVERDFAAARSVSDAAGPYVLPIVRGSGRIEYRTVNAVVVEASSLPAAWEVYVDGTTGDPVARRQLFSFAGAHIDLDVPERYPEGGRTTLPASFLQLSVEGLERFTDVIGYFTWSSGTRDVGFRMRGPYVHVNNDDGSDVRFEHQDIRDGDDEVFGAPDDEYVDAQVSIFAHANFVKEYVRSIALNPWLDETLLVHANLVNSPLPVSHCNAFYDPTSDTLNFLPQGVETVEREEGDDVEVECANTGRLADVIYHEFGHAIHTNSYLFGDLIPDGSLGEGVADYLAVTITGDPGMGRGFFISRSDDPEVGVETPMRHVDPESLGGTRKVYPDDFEDGREFIHFNGLIIGQTLWQLREELIDAHGQTAGIAQADRIWYGIIQRAEDMPSSYAEALAADDDDGDLSNGSPNSCIINRVFGAGGLGNGSGIVVPGVELPILSGYDLSLPVSDPAGCEPLSIGSVRVHWKRRGESGSGTLNMEPSSGGYSLGLPEQADGTLFQYQVEVIFENGSTATYPNNPADPHYQHFVGETEEVYCTTFDTDPFGEEDDEDAWYASADEGEDEWEWGEPKSRGLGGAPIEAHAGGKVLATDLGEHSNGLYEPSSRTWVRSPEIDIYGQENPRLQFRRWLAADRGDRARIYVNDQLVWESGQDFDGEGDVPDHRDREWAFHDIDLRDFRQDGQVVIRFEMESDDQQELAGWAIDDFCVVDHLAQVECPDFERGQTCDGECPPGCEPPDDEDGDGGAARGGNSGCGCAAGDGGAPSAGALLLSALVGLALLRRRRDA